MVVDGCSCGSCGLSNVQIVAVVMIWDVISDVNAMVGCGILWFMVALVTEIYICKCQPSHYQDRLAHNRGQKFSTHSEDHTKKTIQIIYRRKETIASHHKSYLHHHPTPSSSPSTYLRKKEHKKLIRMVKKKVPYNNFPYLTNILSGLVTECTFFFLPFSCESV